MTLPARMALVAACLASLAWLATETTRFAETRPAGIRAALADPSSFHERPLTLLMWTVESPTQLRHRDQAVTVHALDPHLEPGATVTVQGFFDATDRSVHARTVTVHQWRGLERALGLVGGAAAVLALPLGFRVEHGALVERG